MKFKLLLIVFSIVSSGASFGNAFKCQKDRRLYLTTDRPFKYSFLKTDSARPLSFSSLFEQTKVQEYFNSKEGSWNGSVFNGKKYLEERTQNGFLELFTDSEIASFLKDNCADISEDEVLVGKFNETSEGFKIITENNIVGSGFILHHENKFHLISASHIGMGTKIKKIPSFPNLSYHLVSVLDLPEWDLSVYEIKDFNLNRNNYFEWSKFSFNEGLPYFTKGSPNTRGNLYFSSLSKSKNVLRFIGIARLGASGSPVVDDYGRIAGMYLRYQRGGSYSYGLSIEKIISLINEHPNPLMVWKDDIRVDINNPLTFSYLPDTKKSEDHIIQVSGSTGNSDGGLGRSDGGLGRSDGGLGRSDGPEENSDDLLGNNNDPLNFRNFSFNIKFPETDLDNFIIWKGKKIPMPALPEDLALAEYYQELQDTKFNSWMDAIPLFNQKIDIVGYSYEESSSSQGVLRRADVFDNKLTLKAEKLGIHGVGTIILMGYQSKFYFNISSLSSNIQFGSFDLEKSCTSNVSGLTQQFNCSDGKKVILRVDPWTYEIQMMIKFKQNNKEKIWIIENR